ncbi:MAG: DUF1559 domain-containing protein [Planctomycetota bacterium]
MMKLKSYRRGLTLVEVVVITGVIGVLIGLLLPATRSSREAARRMSCSNQFKQIGLAIHQYHSSHGQLPMQMGGTFDAGSDSGGTSPPGNNRYRLSWMVGILPFIEQQSLWESISAPQNGAPTRFAPMGPAPWTRQFTPWQTDVASFRCPSDPGFGDPAAGRTNYAICLGDATHWLNTGGTRWDTSIGRWADNRQEQVGVSGRGMFIPRRALRFRDVHDGLSNTLMAGEIATDLEDHDIRTEGSLRNAWNDIHDMPLLCEEQVDSSRPHFWLPNLATASVGDQARGMRWADGAGLYTGMNTIRPPNAAVCIAGGDRGIGMLPPSSRHSNGCHVLLGDGAIRFIVDSIDCGDQQTGTVWISGEGSRKPGAGSPYGLWGALGSRDCSESLEAI